MRILFVHQYFPGQFARLARHFVEQGHEVVAYHRGLRDGRSSEQVPGVRELTFGAKLKPDPDESSVFADTHRFLREAANIAGEARMLVREGWIPDVVYSHTGWGTAAYLHDLFPQARFVKYCEWFYSNSAETSEFLEPGAPRPLQYKISTSMMNLPILADLAHGDLFIAPTEWQKSQFPNLVRDRIEIAPDGIDMDFFAPDPNASVTLPDGRRLTRQDRVVTYVARGADPFRGFKPFLDALALLQKRDPVVEALIVGDRKVYYGKGHGTEDHFDSVIGAVETDPARTHFLGRLPYEQYRDVLHVSSAHAYLTVPFVLSWSMLEAMAAGCVIIGSDTSPVREFITDGKTGFLADFFAPEEIAARIETALNGGESIESIRRLARAEISRRWSAQVALARHEELLARVMEPRAD